MSRLHTIIQDAVVFLEHNRRCPKHHIEHTGSNAYLLDFYDFLGEIESGKKLIDCLLTLIVDNPTGGKVFYPGHLNPMNMSQNSIDTGTSVDAIARFAYRRRSVFTEHEHTRISSVLREVVETYLLDTARNKQITNQRLWALTGVASYARYVGEESEYRGIAHESIEQAFVDMTTDGFFRYYPNPTPHLIPYDGISAFYQSRHTAFINYILNTLGMDIAPYEERINKSTSALLSMYTHDGLKDMRMECKRWYWLSSYEVASNSFDAYALAGSNIPGVSIALNNTVYQIRNHFFDKHIHSHIGEQLNFQCPIFWTAHLAWLIRIDGAEVLFEEASAVKHFEYTFQGKEVFTHTDPKQRVLANTRWGKRNPTTGIFENGLQGKTYWSIKIPHIPYAYFFNLRETINHIWYALRGLHIKEAITRLLLFSKESLIMLLPRYSVRYGRLESINYSGGVLTTSVTLASKYGTTLDRVSPIKTVIDVLAKDI